MMLKAKSSIPDLARYLFPHLASAFNPGASRRSESLSLRDWSRNFGQTAALSAGIERASGDVIIPMDGDLQNDPADIPRLLEKMQSDGFECVSGWRKNRKDSGTRVLPSKIANALISWLSGVYIH